MDDVCCKQGVLTGIGFACLALSTSIGFLIAAREFESTPLWVTLSWTAFFAGAFSLFSKFYYNLSLFQDDWEKNKFFLINQSFNFVNFLSQILSVQYTTFTMATIFGNTAFVFGTYLELCFLGCVFSRDVFLWRQLFIAMAITGIVLVAWKSIPRIDATSQIIGGTLAMVGSAACASNSVTIRYAVTKYPEKFHLHNWIAAWSVSSCLMAFIAFFIETYSFQFQKDVEVYHIGTGCLLAFLSVSTSIAFVNALFYISVSAAKSIQALTVPAGFMYGIFRFGEAWTAMNVSGAILVFIAIVVCEAWLHETDSEENSEDEEEHSKSP